VRELWWDVPRAMEVHLTGLDLDGNELSLEGTELLARVFQHETDHLDGVIILDRITADERKQAMGVLRERILELPGRS
jgi:peptide deformylase